MKKKFVILFFICSVSFLFTSCVEIVQTIDFCDGNYKIGYRLTLNKTLLAMGGEDSETFLDDMDFSDLPEGVTANTIDTSLDIGFGFDIIVDPKTTEEIRDFLPKVLKDGRIEIPLIAKDFITDMEESEYSSESETIRQAMLSSAKWRVYITKNLLSSISKVYLENTYRTQKLEYFEIGDVYVINIPIIFIEKDTDLIIEK